MRYKSDLKEKKNKNKNQIKVENMNNDVMQFRDSCLNEIFSTF